MARLSFRCSAELVESVDLARGDVARERWLRAVVEGAVAGALVAEVESRRLGAAERVVADPGLHDPATVVSAERVLGDAEGMPSRAPAEVAPSGAWVPEWVSDAEQLPDPAERSVSPGFVGEVDRVSYGREEFPPRQSYRSSGQAKRGVGPVPKKKG